MSYQEMKGFVSVISTLLLFAGYSLFVFTNHHDAIIHSTASLSFWGTVIVALILISILAKIVISIEFILIYRAATKEQEPSFADELDKLIQLKASRTSYMVFIIGFLLSMVSLALAWPLSVTFTVLLFSGFLAEIADGTTQIYLYRRGI